MNGWLDERTKKKRREERREEGGKKEGGKKERRKKERRKEGGKVACFAQATPLSFDKPGRQTFLFVLACLI